MIEADSVTVTVLVDNLAPEPLVPEYGFAALVTSDTGAILFDTGQLDALVRNAAILGIDLGLPRILVLSHGHYDHTGGLAELFQINPELTVFFHPGLSSGHYSLHPGKPVKNISMPEPSRRVFEGIS
ncbi:MAG: MBL fold metallo-hydrolase, partial [Victivallaceae bacterium]